MQSGMNAVLEKPIDPDKLIEIAGHTEWENTPDIVNEEWVDEMAGDSFADAVDDSQTNDFAQQAPASDPEPVISKAEVFDRQAIQSLRDNLSDADLKEMLDSLFDKSDELIAAMQDAFEKDDLESVRLRAHEIKGMCGNFGLSTISALSGEIEDLLRGEFDDTTQLGKLIARLPEAKAEAKSALDNWLSQA